MNTLRRTHLLARRAGILADFREYDLRSTNPSAQKSLDSSAKTLDDGSMFGRTVSIALIAAVVACPLSCDIGLCNSGQCCSIGLSSQQASPVHIAAECCCKDACSNSEQPEPCRRPSESFCQGVCGGAVFEKPVEIDDASESAMLFTVDTTDASGTRLLERHTTDHVGDHCCSHAGNVGRALRTLHMSLLC